MIKRIADCLPADVQLRIEGIKARAHAGEAKRSGVGAGQREGKTRAVPVGEEWTTGNIVRMPLRNGTAKLPTGCPSGTVVPFRKGIERGHASTRSSVVLSS